MRYRQSFRQQREEEQQQRSAAGLISERYAGIAGIQFHMIYYHRSRDPVLMERFRNLVPVVDVAGGALVFSPLTTDKVLDAIAQRRPGTGEQRASNG